MAGVGERGRTAKLGASLYNVGGYETDGEDYPVFPGLPLPSWVHQPLFRSSRAWEYAVLALAPTGRYDDVVPLFDEVMAASQAAGTTLVLVFMPELERPFGAPSPIVDEVQERLRDWAREHGVPGVDVGRAFAGVLDHEQVRLDRCCHYNKSGHAALAGLFATMVRDLDDGRLDETPGRLD